jgi:hypothetical protein
MSEGDLMNHYRIGCCLGVLFFFVLGIWSFSKVVDFAKAWDKVPVIDD